MWDDTLITCVIIGVFVYCRWHQIRVLLNYLTRTMYWKIKSRVKKIDISEKEITKGELVTVYAFREFTVDHNIELKENFYTLDNSERVLGGIDHYCLMCKSMIQIMMRRVLHSNGSECYVCYRKRIDCVDFQKFLLVSYLPWGEEVDNLTRLLFLDYYRALRVELLVIRRDNTLTETTDIIPTFNHYLSLFPDVPVPEWIDEQFVWFAYAHQQREEYAAIDILLWERILPKRNRKVALARLVDEFGRVKRFDA